jgi:glycosyltransferase involved in cell wall biosynthesis
MGGAVEKVWFALGQEFVRHGCEVWQISRAHPDLPLEETIEGVRHLRVAGYSQPRSLVWLKWLDLLYSRRVRRVLPKSDILVTNTFWLPLLVRQKDRGRLYVHVARGPKGQMRWYRHAARLQAVSNSIANQIIAEAPQLRSKVRVIPNALPFRIEESDSAGRERIILYVGRIHPEKGIELFLRSLAYLPAQVQAQWKVRMVGPHEPELGGGGEAFLQQMRALAEKTAAQIEWRGKIFDPQQLTAQYRSSLVFVYPSLAETGEAMPVAPLEAMANGCVPFVSKLDCFRDYISDGVNGYVFDHRASQPERALAERLSALLQLEREQILKIGETAQLQAGEFELEKVAPRYLEDFANLLKEDA